ncbi:DUF262 domain-containing protein [Pseudomonas fluorescens]|uniref:DUF262 domain-containing protein n=1 Tax=Pseudomonas fluorescens TaxID=294 RepID=UPI00178148AC|nr:DUF262 domain-containing protein [Pseudomonas fluorescens]MBD8147856.1 DUF262 domain-containing protein [Pseudomonas fluorescens]MBD8177754.1 DUF262 domain-containing protein [Pseudomonas fluorescens]MBD8747233.1 DUF262 domain-containing protein [Pseudomonas fluorescens]MBD8750989.1 DUF262 domain-containing protein [Pseudomonas fluorescens]MBD8760523.1 DUF262 domain-containing protein [Pseudomonas fluorescens]
MQLNPLHLKVSKLLEGRLFRIPEYQRAYSWQSRQRADLFNDIREAYRSGREHFMATLVALAKETREINADEFRAVELVDGQQRTTTLIILFKALEKSLDSSITSEADIKKDLAKLLVKGDEHSLILLQTNHDSSKVFTNYIRSGLVSEPKNPTVADTNLVKAAQECERFVQDWKNSEGSIVSLISTVRNKLSVIYHEIQDQATVYRVFEVLNSRGLDVKWIDKLKSQLMALIFEHVEDEKTRGEASDEMKMIWKNIYQALGNESKIGDEALRFAGTWAVDTRPNRIISEQDATAELTRKAGTSLKSIAVVGHELEAVVLANLKLSRNNRLRAVTRISHARFVASAIILRAFKSKEEQLLLEKWERVTFRIFELGGADTRHKVGDYVRLGYDIYRSCLSSDEIQERLDSISQNFSIKDVLKSVDWTDSYNNWGEQLRYLLYRYDEHLAKEAGEKINATAWNKIWQAEPSSSIEHIHPQSSGASYVHQLGNLTMLPPGINSSLNKRPAKEKFKTYLSCGLRATMEVGLSIEERNNWSEAMIKKRTKQIEDFIRLEWSD